MLECKNLGIQFGGLKAVDNFNLNIEKGMLYGLIGPNGAGKTTVFNLLTGVYKPSSGTIRLNGNLINGKTPTQINNMGVARTFQNIRLFSNMSVLDNVKVALHEKVKYPLITSMTHLFGFDKKEKEMDDMALEILDVFSLGDKKDILSGNLPYGEQRKLEIARALATGPSLLLLDEPAAGMNPNETEELMDTIRKIRDMYDMTILLIEHDMKLVAGICEKLTVLNFGTELASGTPGEVLNNSDVITAYLGE
ncbi:ABC transporter ATP-binding protein [Lachnoanaerobaculum umeaense]|jgi:ABC transporter related|uniref:ABC transporter ATP-binding protein n=1 Tax=Lachnoanaerobaculum umeaense TaxID=617123 RepID=A0A385Q0U2_9FIRM|nr:ABC transporter ATP-binding protein [Lachnoanaerobaculum umeaense]AYA99835.1 ABC transporter ATP-binding protein [Lachnoanaerobaculum umeaense]PZW96821.1 amino acid/amide ABC transporter ATP-binding protein 1 (HAAT family) [Lachnoanaerobaculum umeaense]